MSDLENLVDRYLAIWNEADSARRRDMIAENWAPDATYRDPMMQGAGHDGIDALVQGVQTKFPGFRFIRTGKTEMVGDQIRFSWLLGPAGGEALAGGTDFAQIVDDRFQTVTGFIDFLPTMAS